MIDLCLHSDKETYVVTSSPITACYGQIIDVNPRRNGKSPIGGQTTPFKWKFVSPRIILLKIFKSRPPYVKLDADSEFVNIIAVTWFFEEIKAFNLGAVLPSMNQAAGSHEFFRPLNVR